MKAHKREVPRCLERTSAARRKEENLCLHEDIISSRIRALITAKKRRTAVSYSSAECCLERTNFARTKNRTAAGTSLEAAFSWEGFWRLCEMFAFLSEFFLWTNYSRTKPRGSCAPRGGHICPRCGQFRGFTRAFQTQRKTAGGRCGMKKARRFKGNRGVPTKNTR